MFLLGMLAKKKLKRTTFLPLKLDASEDAYMPENRITATNPKQNKGFLNNPFISALLCAVFEENQFIFIPIKALLIDFNNVL